MGRNLPPGVSVSDLPGCEPPNEAPRAECAVCGKPLDVNERPDKHQFCDNHDEEDLRLQAQRAEEQRPDDAWERFYERE